MPASLPLMVEGDAPETETVGLAAGEPIDVLPPPDESRSPSVGNGEKPECGCRLDEACDGCRTGLGGIGGGPPECERGCECGCANGAPPCGPLAVDHDARDDGCDDMLERLDEIGYWNEPRSLA